MSKMFLRPFQPLGSEDQAKTPHVEFIQSDVIGPMQTQVMCGYSYISMCTDDHSRYREVYFMNAKSVAPVKFK